MDAMTFGWVGNGYVNATLLQQLIGWANLIACARVVFICYFAAQTEWHPEIRRKFIRKGVVATAYVTAYVVLLYGPFSRSDWSLVVQTLGPYVWWVEWPDWPKFRAQNRETNRFVEKDELVQIMAPPPQTEDDDG